MWVVCLVGAFLLCGCPNKYEYPPAPLDAVEDGTVADYLTEGEVIDGGTGIEIPRVDLSGGDLADAVAADVHDIEVFDVPDFKEDKLPDLVYPDLDTADDLLVDVADLQDAEVTLTDVAELVGPDTVDLFDGGSELTDTAQAAEVFDVEPEAEDYQPEMVSGICGDDLCEEGESPDDCPEDCGGCGDGKCSPTEQGLFGSTCPVDCLVACGNGLCQWGENELNCLADCGTCGDSFCQLGEDKLPCPEDCPAQCGDGLCEEEESYETCLGDCPPPCGDGNCQWGENPYNCPFDCFLCGDGLCAMKESSEECPADCQAGCGNGECDPEETPLDCPGDCASCGDGQCSASENHFGCPEDCPGWCGDGVCAAPEHALSCTPDCVWCGDAICSPEESADCADCQSDCGDFLCLPGETPELCPVDCGFCGDGVCSLGEGGATCLKDCTLDCGDGDCLGEESAGSCPVDCVVDYDQDGIENAADNCPFVVNSDVSDIDGDGLGPECDLDDDGDGELDATDCAPADAAISHLAAEVCDGADNDCNGQTDEATCDDAIDCTQDVCADMGEDGYACVFAPVDNSCDDVVACTVDICVPGAGCENSPEDGNCDDADPCTADSCDSQAGCQHEGLTGPECSDGDVCTLYDTCDSGVCVPGASLVCDDSNPCTLDQCDKLTGCDYPPAVAGVCADLDVCNGQESCLAGECVAGESLVCDDENPCTDDSCDSILGCQYAPDNGNSCDDGNVCNGGETCSSGDCEAGEMLDCEDGNNCTEDICDPADGCIDHIEIPGCDPDADLDGDPDDTDCDDEDPTVHHGAAELCNGVDNDCNGEPDSALLESSGSVDLDTGVSGAVVCDAEKAMVKDGEAAVLALGMGSGQQTTIDGEVVSVCTGVTLPATRRLERVLFAGSISVDGCGDFINDGLCTADVAPRIFAGTDLEGLAYIGEVGCDELDGEVTELPAAQVEADYIVACRGAASNALGNVAVDYLAATVSCHCSSPTPELCNGEDDNCDGQADEEACAEACQWGGGAVLLSTRNYSAFGAGPGIVFVAGGMEDNAPLARVEWASLSDGGLVGTWYSSASLVEARLYAAAAVSEETGFAYVSGGLAGGGGLALVESAQLLEDGGPDVWSDALGPLPEPRWGHCMVAHGEYLHVVGGTVQGVASDSVLRIPLTEFGFFGDDWESEVDEALPQKLSDMGCARWGNRYYVFGGIDDAGQPVQAAYVGQFDEDGVLSDWTELHQLPSPVVSPACAVNNTHAYCAGGLRTPDGGQQGPSVDVLVGRLDSAGMSLGWLPAPPLAAPVGDGPPGAVLSSSWLSVVSAEGAEPPSVQIAVPPQVDGCYTDCGLQAPSDFPCLDDNPCTVNETCNYLGYCVGGGEPDCGDGNDCTTDFCDSLEGCINLANQDLCDDGNACTRGERCQGGVCAGGYTLEASDCTDGVFCTTDTCDDQQGCTHANNTSNCNDGNSCTSGDKCSAGVCRWGNWAGVSKTYGFVCLGANGQPSGSCGALSNGVTLAPYSVLRLEHEGPTTVSSMAGLLTWTTANNPAQPGGVWLFSKELLGNNYTTSARFNSIGNLEWEAALRVVSNPSGGAPNKSSFQPKILVATQRVTGGSSTVKYGIYAFTSPTQAMYWKSNDWHILNKVGAETQWPYSKSCCWAGTTPAVVYGAFYPNDQWNSWPVAEISRNANGYKVRVTQSGNLLQETSYLPADTVQHFDKHDYLLMGTNQKYHALSSHVQSMTLPDSCNCTAGCGVKTCGYDGCGNPCGAHDGNCQTGHDCVNNACVCHPQCGGLECGDDGCGAQCGDCAGPQDQCLAGLCVCVPDCNQKECGDDGCGGQCGVCQHPLEECLDGLCACKQQCGGRACGDDHCGGVCGICPWGQVCHDDELQGECLPAAQCDAPCGALEVCAATGRCVNDLHHFCPDLDPNDGPASVCKVWMGTTDDSPADALPEHLAPVGTFLMDLTEVTAGQYSVFLQEEGNLGPAAEDLYHYACGDYGPLDCDCDGDGCDYGPWGTCTQADGSLGDCSDHPIVGVTWFGADAYCQWAGKRLCTEAQWEYAAAGDAGENEEFRGRTYPWGDLFDPVAEGPGANCLNVACKDEFDSMSPVAVFPDHATPEGLLDLAGNVSEWVLDWYADDYYCEGDGAENNGYEALDCLDVEADWALPTVGPCQGAEEPCAQVAERVIRGGSFKDSPLSLEVARRDSLAPAQTAENVGFRCCADAPTAD